MQIYLSCIEKLSRTCTTYKQDVFVCLSGHCGDLVVVLVENCVLGGYVYYMAAVLSLPLAPYNFTEAMAEVALVPL